MTHYFGLITDADDYDYDSRFSSQEFIQKFMAVCCYLSSVSLCLISDEGYYQSGRFQFEIDVPEAYNMVVSSSMIY